jgi:hypothetical protein
MKEYHCHDRTKMPHKYFRHVIRLSWFAADYPLDVFDTGLKNQLPTSKFEISKYIFSSQEATVLRNKLRYISVRYLLNTGT